MFSPTDLAEYDEFIARHDAGNPERDYLSPADYFVSGDWLAGAGTDAINAAEVGRAVAAMGESESEIPY